MKDKIIFTILTVFTIAIAMGVSFFALSGIIFVILIPFSVAFKWEIVWAVWITIFMLCGLGLGQDEYHLHY